MRTGSQTMGRDRAEVGSIRSRQRLYSGTGTGYGLLVMNSSAVVAQIDKDIENLTTFFQAKVELYQRKQFQSVLEPMHAIRALYTCPPTPADLVEAYQVAKASVRNAMSALSAKCGPGRRSMSVRVAEAIWSSRSDVTRVCAMKRYCILVNILRIMVSRRRMGHSRERAYSGLLVSAPFPSVQGFPWILWQLRILDFCGRRLCQCRERCSLKNDPV